MNSWLLIHPYLFQFSKLFSIGKMNNCINSNIITNILIVFLFSIFTAEFGACSWFPFCSVLTTSALMIMRCKLNIWQENENTKYMKDQFGMYPYASGIFKCHWRIQDFLKLIVRIHILLRIEWLYKCAINQL